MQIPCGCGATVGGNVVATGVPSAWRYTRLADATLYVGPVEPVHDRLRVLTGKSGTIDMWTLRGALWQLRDDSRIHVQIRGAGQRAPLETFARAKSFDVEFLPCSKRNLGHVCRRRTSDWSPATWV